MNKIKNTLSLSLILLITFSLTNCNSDKNKLESTSNAKVTEVTFKIPSTKTNFNDNSDVENFLEYVYFDDIPANQFINDNNIDKVSFVNVVENKVLSFNNNYSSRTSSKKPPTLEEIRDAMINECQNGYCCGLDDACEIAVKIAYHIKKAQQ
ncbi:MAG: hypothetical protein ACPGUU_06300 [Flavobacteriaceae bacterium]